MGVVYKARDPRLDRQVAIKMMTGGFVDNPDLLKRFFREAQSLGSLQHPNIVTVYELGDFDGNPYLVMQYLEGEGLDTVFTARRQLSFLEKINIMIQVCTGLAYAHQRGVVHRDIKPANVMLAKDGSIKIFDFGIAHIGDQSVTKTGQMIGTPPYMSPEQVNGKTLDARTDLFSAGVVLYQLLTNHLPFEGDSTANTFLKILYDPPTPLNTFLSTYPPELETILLRALAKDPEERYHSADEFALELGHLQAQLKQELIAQHMKEVGLLLEKVELHKAREFLLQVLKTDPQHVQATQMLREVQQRIKKEEVGEQVRKLRQRAEEAAAQEQFETAQERLDQALALDKNNPELNRLRETLRNAALRAQKLHNALKLAESAHQDGDLDAAKQAIEEALQISPNDTQAKALYRVIQRDWVERSRQRQLENYLFQARQDISSRKFTAALETLKLAEALDSSAPQVHALMESAAAGREQERRRKDLEAITRGIEDALNRDDYREACLKADEGLARFPEERTLLKLKTLADRQRQIEQRRQLIEEQLALARTLLQEGRNEELLTALETAIGNIGPEPRLQSLLTIVTENVQRERLERRKTEYLQRAKESLRNKEYDSAIEKLEAARTELKGEPEIEDLLQFVKEEAAAERRRRAAEAAAQKAQSFVAEQNYEEAIRLLEATLRESPDGELRIVLAETRRAAVDYQEKLESVLASAEKLLQARKSNEALKLLESQPAGYLRNAGLAKLLETARREAERGRRVDAAIERSRRILEDEDYVGARRVLEECRQANGTTPELDSQLALVGQRRATAATRSVEKAMGDARIFVKAGEYQAALDKLQSVAQLASDVSTTLRAEYRSLQQQSTTGLAHGRKTQIERFVAGGELTRAADLLRQSLAQFPEDRELSNLNQVLDQETKRRSDARECLAEAQKAFASANWKAGGDLLKKAFASATRVPALRDQVLDAFVQGGVSAVETDWRAAESLLHQLAELQSDTAPPSVLWSRIRERKREEFVSRCVAECQRLLSAGQLQEALREVDAGLASYSEVASLKELRGQILQRTWQEEERTRQERTRLEKEAFLREISGRVEREPAIDRRIPILDEALARYPHEPSLQQQSAALRDLWQRISAIVAEARALESAGKYDDALGQWETLRTLHRQHPDLEQNILRIARLRDQARASARASWLEKIQHELAAFDLDRARALLLEAVQEFPGDQDLSRLEQQLADAIKLRAKAQKLLIDSGKSFEKLRWDKGLDALNRALELAGRDAVVQEQAVHQLAQASEAAIPTDLVSAQTLLDRAAALHPASAWVPALRRKIQEHKHEQTVLDRLARARRAQQAGDLQGSLRELVSALATYPGDQRFIQAKNEVELQLQQLEEQRAREREKARRLEAEQARERERKRQEDLERERARAQEEERRRKDAQEKERLRAQEEERNRKEALERERIRAQEAERKRQEELEQERLRAQAAERERQEARERERIRAQEAERKRQEELEQEKLRAVEREKERERERMRLEALEQERQQAERRRLEEAQRLRDEALRKEEQLRRERAVAQQLEQEQKQQEKARKREERERKQAEAAETRRQEKETQRLLKEERRQQALKQKEEETAIRRAAVDTTVDGEDVSATRVFDQQPVRPPETSRARPAQRLEVPREKEKEKEASQQWSGLLAALEPHKRLAILAGSGLLLVLVATGVWMAFHSHVIRVQVTTSPEGAAVTLMRVGQTGQKKECVTPHCNFDLVAGTYALEIQHEGYQPANQTIEVSAKGPRSFPVSLAAVPPPPSQPPSKTNLVVRMDVRGAPAGGEVLVDGTSVGKVGRNGEFSAKVTTGDHQIKIVAKDEISSIVTRTFEAGRVVSLNRDDFYPKTFPPPGEQPAPEDVDWKTAQGSSTIDSVEEYLRKHPTGPHSAEARAMLENLNWAKDSQANTADAYKEYVRLFPDGPHAAAAEEEATFLEARDRRDLATFDAFVAKYPSSRHRSEIDARRDDLTWQQTNKTDDKSLSAYLKAFPKGQHAEDARSQQQQLANVVTKPSPQPTPSTVLPPAVDDRKALLAVLELYRSAYDHMSADDLTAIWPGVPQQGRLFADISSSQLSYKMIGNPEINGDVATARLAQSIRLVDKHGTAHKLDNQVTMKFRKAGDKHGPTGGWLIDSIAGK
jgi:serine/threonine-protein kinase